MDVDHQLVVEMHEILKLKLFSLPDKGWGGVGTDIQASSLKRAVVSVWNRGCISSAVNDRGKYSSSRNVSFSEHYTVNRVKKK
jgi:hypothetical protein